MKEFQFLPLAAAPAMMARSGMNHLAAINRKPASSVEILMLSAGDQVTVLFKNKPFQGVVDP